MSRVAATVFALAVLRALASSKTVSVGVPRNITSINIASNVAKMSIEWETKFDGADDAAPVVKVTYSDTTFANPTLDRGSLQLHLLPDCAKAVSSSTSAVRPWSSTTATLACGALLLPQRQVLPALGCSLVGVAVLGVSGDLAPPTPCGSLTVKLSLHVPKNQAAGVSSCSHCRWEHMAFWIKPPCNLRAAAEALNATLANCTPEGSNGTALVDGVPAYCQVAESCGFRSCSYHAPPAQCSIPVDIADSCLLDNQPILQELLVDAIGGSASAAGRFARDLVGTCVSKLPRPVEGRPYSSDDGAMLAKAEFLNLSENSCSWVVSPSATNQNPSGWTRELAFKAARAWLEHGQHEHASVASFSRFSLELLRFAAPPSLLRLAHRAAAEEVRHAQLAFGLAASLHPTAGGAAPGPFPIGTSVELVDSLPDLAAQVFREGCVGESLAVTRLSLALLVVQAESPARPVLEELLQDEARHAALAWATLHWARRASLEIDFSAHVGRIAGERSAAVALRRSFDEELTLQWSGRLPAADGEVLDAMASRHWIAPWAAAAGDDLPAVQLTGPHGDAVTRAAALVRQSLVDIGQELLVDTVV